MKKQEKQFNNITDMLCDLATGEAFGISKLMLRCPMMQAVLSKENRSSNFDDLSSEQISNLVRHTALEDWLTGDDAQKMLNISERTLQTLRSNGTLAYSKLNGKLYYRRQDLQDLLSNNYKFSKIIKKYDGRIKK